MTPSNVALQNNVHPFSRSIKTVHLNNSVSHYTKIDNNTLRVIMPGEKVRPKDIWLYALTCQNDWIFTTKTIAKRFNIPERKARAHLTFLKKYGFADTVRLIDHKTKQITGHRWLFYESPLSVSGPETSAPEPETQPETSAPEPETQNHDYGNLNPKSDKPKETNTPDENSPKSQSHKKDDTGAIIDLEKKKEQHLEKTTTGPTPKKTPEPPPKNPPEAAAPYGAVVDYFRIKELIHPDIFSQIPRGILESNCRGKSEQQIKWASDQAIEKANKNKRGYFLIMLGVPMTETSDEDLKQAPYPTDPDAPQVQIDKIFCYNTLGISGQCSFISGKTKTACDNCRKYCPYMKGIFS